MAATYSSRRQTTGRAGIGTCRAKSMVASGSGSLFSRHFCINSAKNAPPEAGSTKLVAANVRPEIKNANPGGFFRRHAAWLGLSYGEEPGKVAQRSPASIGRAVTFRRPRKLTLWAIISTILPVRTSPQIGVHVHKKAAPLRNGAAFQTKAESMLLTSSAIATPGLLQYGRGLRR